MSYTRKSSLAELLRCLCYIIAMYLVMRGTFSMVVINMHCLFICFISAGARLVNQFYVVIPFDSRHATSPCFHGLSIRSPARFTSRLSISTLVLKLCSVVQIGFASINVISVSKLLVINNNQPLKCSTAQCVTSFLKHRRAL